RTVSRKPSGWSLSQAQNCGRDPEWDGALMSVALKHLHALMRESLAAWRLIGSVHSTNDGAILVSCRGHNIRVEQAPPDLPFRWVVIVDDHRGAATSVVAVLRQARAALAPGYATMRARIAPFPLVPT